MKCLAPITVNKYMTVNCGRCHNCRVNYTSMWTLRCLYELDSWISASFITLTYDDEHLPPDYGLRPEDLANFWKRLRKRIYPRKIKYYACGEYGDKTKRPHYHAIVFGLDSYNEQDRQDLIDCWSLCDPYMFDKNRKQNGMLPVCREDIAYVTGYVQKKLNGDMAHDEYGDKIRPFSRCSRGIGLDFALKNSDRLSSNGYTFLNGQKIAIPRYFREKLGLEQTDLIDSKLDKRKIEENTNYLYNLFIEDMKKANTYYPDNLTMMSLRFEKWLENYNFSIASRVEKDYLKRNQLKGRYL